MSVSLKRATSSIRSISRVTSRARHVGTRKAALWVAVEAEPVEDLGLLVLGDADPEHGVAALRPQPDRLPLGQRPLHVDVARPACAGEPDDELSRECRSGAGYMRVDAFLPPVGALGAQRVPLGALQDPDRLEVRGLQEHRRRVLADLGLRAAHDPGERDRTLGVGDHEVGRIERAQVPVERPQLLAGACAAHDHDAALQRARAVRLP